MTPQIALEIIAAYGADSARWPDADRAAVLALAAADANVALALRDAEALDGLIARWAHDVPPRLFDAAAITAQPQERPAAANTNALPLRWIGGGALAAAVAAGLIVFAPVRPASEITVATLPPTNAALSAAADGTVDGRDAEAFANVFTPTPDEEELI